MLSPPEAPPPGPRSFLVGYSGSNLLSRSQQKRATPTWCYSPHSPTLRFGSLSSVAHTLMWHFDHISASAPVQSLLKHLHLLLPVFRVARFTRSAPHRHLLFQVTSNNIQWSFAANILHSESLVVGTSKAWWHGSVGSTSIPWSTSEVNPIIFS